MPEKCEKEMMLAQGMSEEEYDEKYGPRDTFAWWNDLWDARIDSIREQMAESMARYMAEVYQAAVRGDRAVVSAGRINIYPGAAPTAADAEPTRGPIYTIDTSRWSEVIGRFDGYIHTATIRDATEDKPRTPKETAKAQNLALRERFGWQHGYSRR